MKHELHNWGHAIGPEQFPELKLCIMVAAEWNRRTRRKCLQRVDAFLQIDSCWGIPGFVCLFLFNFNDIMDFHSSPKELQLGSENSGVPFRYRKQGLQSQICLWRDSPGGLQLRYSQLYCNWGAFLRILPAAHSLYSSRELTMSDSLIYCMCAKWEIRWGVEWAWGKKGCLSFKTKDDQLATKSHTSTGQTWQQHMSLPRTHV